MPRDILAIAAKAILPLVTDVATDPRNLKPGELCRLLNSTPLGQVLTDRRLRTQRTRAGLRIGEEHIDLFRYAAWLVDEIATHDPPPLPADEEELRWRIYESIPQRHWIAMSGRQAKVLNEQASRYGLPFGGATIDLPTLARALHDFLAIHARRLARQMPGDYIEDDDGEAKDNLELYRGERYLRERLKRLAEEQSLLPRVEVHDRFARVAAILRNAGELLQRQFGRDAHQILEEAITECEALVKTLGDDDGPND